MFVTEYHWGVLVAQGTNGDLVYEKVSFTEHFWSPVLKKLEPFLTHSLFMNLLIQGFNLDKNALSSR